MENPQIIALVAIAISVISIGLVAANVFNLQTTLINLNTSLVEQSQTIKSLNQQQNATQQVIEEQRKSIMKIQDKAENLTNEIKSLEERITSLQDNVTSLQDRVTSLEQKLQSQCFIPEGCPPPTPSKPVYFPGVLKFYNAADGGGVEDNRVFKQLPSALPADSWVADFDYQFTSSSIPAAYPLALTSTSANPEQQGPSGSDILVYHGAESDILHLRVQTGTIGADYPSLHTGISISPNTQYYVRLAKTSTELTLSVFSDPARMNQIPGSPINVAIAPTDFSNLKFVQHSTSISSGSGRTLTAQVDNTKIFVKGANGVSQTLFQDDYSSSKGWIQIGSSIAVNGSFVAQMPQVYHNLMP
jgi:TolA-binding protein